MRGIKLPDRPSSREGHMRMRPSDSENYDPQQSYAAGQLSRYDMQVAWVVVFVITIAMVFVIALVMMLFRNEPATQALVPAISQLANSLRA